MLPGASARIYARADATEQLLRNGNSHSYEYLQSRRTPKSMQRVLTCTINEDWNTLQRDTKPRHWQHTCGDGAQMRDYTHCERSWTAVVVERSSDRIHDSVRRLEPCSNQIDLIAARRVDISVGPQPVQQIHENGFRCLPSRAQCQQSCGGSAVRFESCRTRMRDTGPCLLASEAAQGAAAQC